MTCVHWQASTRQTSVLSGPRLPSPHSLLWLDNPISVTKYYKHPIRLFFRRDFLAKDWYCQLSTAFVLSFSIYGVALYMYPLSVLKLRNKTACVPGAMYLWFYSQVFIGGKRKFIFYCLGASFSLLFHSTCQPSFGFYLISNRFYWVPSILRLYGRKNGKCSAAPLDSFSLFAFLSYLVEQDENLRRTNKKRSFK